LDEEEMLDVAEHCFIRVAELMLEKNLSVRGIFTKYSIPEQFQDGSIIELLSPIAFLEGVKEIGLTDLSELEAACLLRVLSKPEIENAIILNELVLIMENFGVIDNFDEDEEDEEEEEEEEEADLSKPTEEGKEEKKSSEKKKPKKKKTMKLNFE